ncbi:TIGR01244 family sulfur transferase [Pacificibacter sp. AS14]|uniref:TIGR01244 family sulfur transferase n=1 Tax=Pacificibacter sp. AS14 TaxID=3135785 RepID=UPI003182A7B2
MDFNKINDQLTVSGQILPTEMTTLVEKGFKTLICNRPDEEVEEALQSAAIETAATAAGLSFRYIPIYPGQFTEDAITELTTAMTELDGPIYAYCRSGTRSCTLWALSQAGVLDADDIISQAADGGYDLRGMAAYLAGK